MSSIPKGRVLAFDPGGRTGVVAVDDGRIVEARTFEFEEMFQVLAGGQQLDLWKAYRVWAIEEFAVYPWTRLKFDKVPAVRVIGALKLAAIQAGDVRVFMQWAANAKKAVPDETLAGLGWSKVCLNDHTRDAARHALFYLYRKGRIR
jgi:hypothetical protein